MKIAAITDDGETISQHFGRAPYYAVFTVEDGKIANRSAGEAQATRSFRRRAGTSMVMRMITDAHEPGRHGYGAEAQSRHARMAASIADCRALLCRGMGWGAYESMKEHGITPIVTDIVDIESPCRRMWMDRLRI